MTDIYTLGIKADTTDIDRGKKSLDNFSGAASKASKRTEEIRAGVDRAGKAVVAFGIVAAAAMGAVAVKAGNAAREIEKLSLLSGQNAEEFQRAAFAARAYGIEQEKLSDIFKDTQDKIGDFLATGGGELINFFEKVAPLAGITKESFRGLSGQEGLQLYVDSLEKANVGQEEMVFFMEAIGNDSTALLPLLRNNGEEFKRIGDRASELGIILDDIDLENLREMNRALSELQSVSWAASNIIGSVLSPFLVKLTNSFLDNADAADDLRSATLKVVGVGYQVAGVFANISSVFTILGKTIGALLFSIVQLGKGVSGAFKEIFNFLIEDGVDAFKLFALTAGKSALEFSNLVIAGVAAGINGMISLIVTGLNELIEKVKPISEKIGLSLSSISINEISLPKIDSTVFDESISKIQLGSTKLISGITNSIDNIKMAFEDVNKELLKPLPSQIFEKMFNDMQKLIKAEQELRKEKQKTKEESKQVANSSSIDAASQISNIKIISQAAETAFGENERIAKALHKINTVIAIAEQARLIQKVIADNAATGSELANSAAKASANGLTAVTSAFAAPFPVNFVAGAAMVGIMSSLLGGFSGGGGASFDPTDDRQEGQGTGSVLGSSDKSGSINKSQERFEDIAIDQLSELRGIRGSLNNIGSGIAQLGKGLVTSNVGDFGGFTGKISGSLGFSSTRTDLLDSGVSFIKQTFEDIIDQGFVDVQQYFDTKTKNTSWFGLSSSTSFDTAFEAIGGGVNEQIAAIFKDIGNTVLQAATTLGFETTSVTTSSITQSFEDFDREDLRSGSLRFFETIFTTTEESLEDALQMFSVDIGKISFEGLSGEEIQAELEAVFSQQADLIAEYLVPSIAEFQNVGEGLFDTLLRVTQEQAVFNDALSNMGVSLAELGNVLQIEIAQGIISLVGGAERFSDLTQSFFSDFFSDAEKFDILTGSITDVFGDLGLALSDNRKAFRELVEGQDLTTEAGRQLFATLLEIAPAMDSYFDTLEERAAEELALAERTASDKARLDEKAATDALRLSERTAGDLLREQEKAAQEAVRLANEQSNLTIRLLSLQGKSEEALSLSREMQLASTTESLRPLLELIFAEEDLIAARVESGEVLEELIDVEQINRDRTSLTIRLLELQGNAEEALTLIRKRELENTTDSLKPLLALIFAEEDLIKSRELSEIAANELEAANLTAAKAAQDLVDETIKQAEAAEAARQDLANAAFTMLNKSIDLEKQRLQAVLDVSKEAYSAELSRLTGLRDSLNAEKSARETNLANSTAALTASFDAEISAINATKDARINSLNTERSAVAANMQVLLGLADKFSQKITDTSTLDQALAAAKRGDFSVAEQLQVQEIDSGGFGSASELNVAQALQANKLQTLSGLASSAAGQASNKLSGIDRQIASAERSAVMQISLLETQRDALLNIDTVVLPLSESIQQYQDSQLALTELAYDDEIAKLDMLVESNQEVYDLHENSYNEQIQSLAEIAEASQEQLNALLNIDSSVLSVSDAIAALAQVPALNNNTDETSTELVRLAQENKDAQAAIAKSAAATAAILQRLELGGLDTRTIT